MTSIRQVPTEIQAPRKLFSALRRFAALAWKDEGSSLDLEQIARLGTTRQIKSRHHVLKNVPTLGQGLRLRLPSLE